MLDFAKEAFEYWYKLAVVVGASLIIASIPAANGGILLLGLGAMLVGFGEFINHPYREIVGRDPFSFGYAKISGHPRRTSIVGIVLDLIGTGLFALGVGKIVWTAIAH
jgi:hypothetical protein